MTGLELRPQVGGRGGGCDALQQVHRTLSVLSTGSVELQLFFGGHEAYTIGNALDGCRSVNK